MSEPFVHCCPWCATKVVEGGLGAAVAVFELHLDQEHQQDIVAAVRGRAALEADPLADAA